MLMNSLSMLVGKGSRNEPAMPDATFGEVNGGMSRQMRLLEESGLFGWPVKISPVPVLVLNRRRQVVFANEAALFLRKDNKADGLTGERLGDLLGCRHAAESPGGCGTTPMCEVCGAFSAILNALEGCVTEQTCHFEKLNGAAEDFEVRARPFDLGGDCFVYVELINTSDRNRRKALERIFFHDLLNAMGGLRGFVDLMRDEPAETVLRYLDSVVELSDRMLDDIRAQQQLVLAEEGDLAVERQAVTSEMIVEDALTICRSHPASAVCLIEVAKDFKNESFITDSSLLVRVIVNLVKNACEACDMGERVTVGGRIIEGNFVFEVRNPGEIPPMVRQKIFKRSFSTKGGNRGLGTYSVKLLTERYLGGRVWLRSNASEGTHFFVSLPLSGPPRSVVREGRYL